MSVITSSGCELSKGIWHGLPIFNVFKVQTHFRFTLKGIYKIRILCLDSNHNNLPVLLVDFMQVQSSIFPSSGHGPGFRTGSSNGSIGLSKPRRGQTRKMMSPSFDDLHGSEENIYIWHDLQGHRILILPRGPSLFGRGKSSRWGSLCSGTSFLRKILVASWTYTYNDTGWCLYK